jgi:hypothetical protein
MGDPVVGVLPPGIGMFPRRMGLVARCGVGTKELYAALFGAKIAQYVSHQFVTYMAVCVNYEAVVAKTARFSGARRQQ